jgi:beta-alanine degradation protein BauB
MLAGKTILLLTVTGLAFAAGFTVAQTTHATGRDPQFENADVKVWKSVVLPNDPLPLHRHEHPRVIIALHGGTMKILEESGQSELHNWQTGKAYWLPANPPGTRHQDVNVGGEPIEVMVVELQNAK